jgi:hypothetical protein
MTRNELLAEYTRLEKIAAAQARSGNMRAWEDAERTLARTAEQAAQLPRTELTSTSSTHDVSAAVGARFTAFLPHPGSIPGYQPRRY